MVEPTVIAPPDRVTRHERWSALGIRGATLWFTGLSGSGKSTIAVEVERMLLSKGQPAYRLDGDILRLSLNEDLGFSSEDRSENLRRMGQVSCLFAEAGTVAIVSAISPLRAHRDAARVLHSKAHLPFLEVWVQTPLHVCESRDPKGLYRRARSGDISDFTGVSAPYEEPETPDVVLDTEMASPGACAGAVVHALWRTWREADGWI
jgi:bifunctional enzyme CysN/CysC